MTFYITFQKKNLTMIYHPERWLYNYSYYKPTAHVIMPVPLIYVSGFAVQWGCKIDSENKIH